MERKRRCFYAFILISFFVLTGCGAKSSKEAVATEDAMMYESESKSDIGFSQMEEETQEMTDSSDDSQQSMVEKGRKLIKRVYLAVETKEFDDFDLFLKNQIETMGGYIESSEVSGNSYYGDRSFRYANLMIRIPEQSLELFLESVSSKSNILRQSSTQEDITLKYIDTKSHTKALKIEQERLLFLLSKAEKLTDIIKLEERLSKVRYEIETYESELRSYDNLVDYSTVTIDIHEVSHITPEAGKTIGERIKTGLSENLVSIRINLQDLMVGFIISLPYLLIWAVIITIISFILVKWIQKKKKKEFLRQAAMSDNIITDNKKDEESE